MGRGKPKGNVHAPKTTQQQMVIAKKLTAKQVKSVQEFRPDDSDDELKMITDSRGESDDDDEEEVFDLDGEEESDSEDGDKDSDGDQDDEDSEDEAGADSDEDDASDDDEDGDNKLKNLVDGLDPRLRQKVMMGGKKGGRAADDDDSDEESEVEKAEGWGKKKAYWSGDTADLEIGQDVQDAEDEEEAAEELQREKLGRMQESDYYEDFGEGKEEADNHAESEQPTGGKKKKSKASGKDKLMDELEYLALGDDNKSSVQIERIVKDVSKLTEDQKIAYVKAQSPELLGLMADLKSRVSELRDKVAPLRAQVMKIAASSSSKATDDIVDYLEVKQQLLLSYCINVTFYLYMKAQGQSVKAHPVMKQLLELRYAMEKMRSLDGKLKHQIDRLMKVSVQGTGDSSGSSSLRPNPLDLLPKGGDDEGSEEEDKPVQSGEFYRAPKMAAAPYKETESESNKREDRLNKKKKKLNSSEIMETLREEFSTAPESSSSSGISKVSIDQRRLQEEADERKDFEEERFVRLTMSRNEKKDIKRRTADASRLDNFNDIGDIGEFEEMAELSKSITKSKKSSSSEGILEEEPKKKGKASMDSADAAKALQRAVSAFSGAAKGKPAKESDDYLAEVYDAKASKGKKSKAPVSDSEDEQHAMDYDDEEEEAPSKNDKKRRRAPAGRMDDDGEGQGDSDYDRDEGDNLLEEFSKKKRDFAAKKKEHYAPEARYGGLIETVPESGKRAATYEIMKNKGLTPHRKKENRNPRVKKRLAYEKAIVRRKGQVREVTAGAAGSYDGELTGIKANIARSRKINN